MKRRPGPCPAAIGPASGLVVLPETARGTFTIFSSPQGCFVRSPGGVEALVRHISEHYRDPSNCLYIALHTWKGGAFSNH